MDNNYAVTLEKIEKPFVFIKRVATVSLVLLVFSFAALAFGQYLPAEILLFLSLPVLAFGFYSLFRLKEEKKTVELKEAINFSEVFSKVQKEITYLAAIYSVSIVLAIIVIIVQAPFSSSAAEDELWASLLGFIPAIVFWIVPALAQFYINLKLLNEVSGLIDQVKRHVKELKNAGLM